MWPPSPAPQPLNGYTSNGGCLAVATIPTGPRRSTVPWGVLQIDPCDQDRKAVRIGEMLPSRRRARKAQPASSTPSTSAPVEASAVTAPQAANHKVDLERWWRYAAIPAKTTMAILTSSTAFQADGCPFFVARTFQIPVIRRTA